MTIAISTGAATAYNTYDALIAAIPEYVDGRVQEEQIPAMVSLVEKEIDRRLALQPVRPQMVRGLLTIDAEYITMPDNFLREITLDFPSEDGNPSTVIFVDPVSAVDERTNPIPNDWLFSSEVDTTGQPQVVAVYDGEFRFYPVPDRAYNATFVYYQKLPPISQDAQTNWFLTEHSDVYLYGLLFHANAFLPDEEKAQSWFQLFDTRLDQVLSSYPRMPDRRALKIDPALSWQCLSRAGL